MIRRRSVVLGIGASILVTNSLPADAIHNAAASGGDGRLQVQGNKIYEGTKQVRLRGVAVGSPLNRAQWERTVTTRLDDYRRIKQDWKANTVRISAYPGDWVNANTACKRELEREIQAARKQGLFVILDWHPVGWPDGRYENNNFDLNSRLSYARAFWDYAAKKWGRDGRVVFELFNEPTAFGVSGSNDSKWKTLKSNLQELLAIVRRSSNNLVLATGEAARVLAPVVKNPLVDTNLAYAWHVYPNHAKDAGYESNPVPYWQSELNKLDQSKPIVVTEWGFDPLGGESGDAHFKGTESGFGKPFINFMNQRQMHWTAWWWYPQDGPRMLGANQRVGGWDWCRPSPFGSLVLRELGAASPRC